MGGGGGAGVGGGGVELDRGVECCSLRVRQLSHNMNRTLKDKHQFFTNLPVERHSRCTEQHR